MLMEKVQWTGGLLGGANLFYLFGLGQLFGYGLSFVMEKDSYDYHFKYTGHKRFFQPLKSMFGSTHFSNVSWTAGFIVFTGHFLQNKVGTLATTKCFGISLLAAYLGLTALGSPNPLSKYQLRDSCWPQAWRFDLVDSKG